MSSSVPVDTTAHLRADDRWPAVAVVSSVIRADDPYRLPRLRVLGGTDPRAPLELIAGARNDPPPPPAYLPHG